MEPSRARNRLRASLDPAPVRSHDGDPLTGPTDGARHENLLDARIRGCPTLLDDGRVQARARSPAGVASRISTSKVTPRVIAHPYQRRIAPAQGSESDPSGSESRAFTTFSPGSIVRTDRSAAKLVSDLLPPLLDVFHARRDTDVPALRESKSHQSPSWCTKLQAWPDRSAGGPATGHLGPG